MTFVEMANAVREAEQAQAAKILADDNESSQFMRDVLLTMPDSTAELSKAHDARARELQRLFRIGDDFAFCAAMRAAMNADIAVYVRDRAEDEANSTDCTGCRETLAGESVCCQEMP